MARTKQGGVVKTARRARLKHRRRLLRVGDREPLRCLWDSIFWQHDVMVWRCDGVAPEPTADHAKRLKLWLLRLVAEHKSIAQVRAPLATRSTATGPGARSRCA